jgi:hypothetical protein
MTKLNYPEPHTEQELRAIEILKNAKIESDADYEALARLIADEVADDVGTSE